MTLRLSLPVVRDGNKQEAEANTEMDTSGSATPQLRVTDRRRASPNLNLNAQPVPHTELQLYLDEQVYHIHVRWIIVAQTLHDLPHLFGIQRATSVLDTRARLLMQGCASVWV